MAQWNFSIMDTSPMLSYRPYSDGFGLQNGWQTWYTTSGFNTQPGESPEGNSYHLTSLSGAEVTFQFYGSAVYLFGTSNSSYEVTLDNTVNSLAPTDGLLYSNEGLIEGTHSVTLTARPTNAAQMLGFTEAIVSTSDQPTPIQTFYDNPNAALSYSGQWTYDTVSGIPNSSVTAPFHQSLNAGSGVFFNFSNATAIALYGSTNFGHELYSVSIDNIAPNVYNGSTFWLVANTVLFFQSGLDPDRSYTLNATNLSPDGKFTLSSVVTYGLDTTQGSSPTTAGALPSSSSKPSHSNPQSSAKIGKIVGPIVGALVFLSLLALFFVFRTRYRRRPRDISTSISPLIIPRASEAPPETTQTPPAPL
ncbi:hypothetical protein GGX14DRAFT_515053, partial [Mycena pura]